MATDPRDRERGIALVLALIFSILLYILVAEIVVSGRLLFITGENDVLLARMRSQMEYTLVEVEDTLLGDLAGQAAAAEGGGLPLGGAGGGLPGAGGQQGEEEADPAADCDSSRDAWAQPQSRADNDLTTYYWVEAENAKFNLLSLWSEDEEWARFSRDQLIRLLDVLREDTDFDLSQSDAERIVSEIEDWSRRQGTDGMPRPPLKSDEKEGDRELSLPIHLDDLLLLPAVDEELFFDKVLDGRVMPGLEAVLTVWTALVVDPGDPEKNARIAARESATSGEGGAPPPPPAETTPPDPQAPPPPPLGQGIRININLAPRPVLRALFPVDKVSDLVIDAIVRHRNEEDTEAMENEQGADPYDFGDLQLGEQTKKKFFASVADLEEIPEFAALPDPQLKADFQRFCTTKSDVFSIHMAAMFRRNEENRAYVMRRARSVIVRMDDGGDGRIYPVVRFEERHGLRVVVPDLQDEVRDLTYVYSEMDAFAQEDRAWNPFLVDFYLPQWQREQFFTRR